MESLLEKKIRNGTKFSIKFGFNLIFYGGTHFILVLHESDDQLFRTVYYSFAENWCNIKIFIYYSRRCLENFENIQIRWKILKRSLEHNISSHNFIASPLHLRVFILRSVQIFLIRDSYITFFWISASLWILQAWLRSKRCKWPEVFWRRWNCYSSNIFSFKAAKINVNIKFPISSKNPSKAVNQRQEHLKLRRAISQRLNCIPKERHKLRGKFLSKKIMILHNNICHFTTLESELNEHTVREWNFVNQNTS